MKYPDVQGNREIIDVYVKFFVPYRMKITVNGFGTINRFASQLKFDVRIASSWKVKRSDKKIRWSSLILVYVPQASLAARFRPCFRLICSRKGPVGSEIDRAEEHIITDGIGGGGGGKGGNSAGSIIPVRTVTYVIEKKKRYAEREREREREKINYSINQ